MIEGQARNPNDSGSLNNIRAVILSSNPNFNDSCINAFPEICMKGSECQEAKVAWLPVTTELLCGRCLEAVPDFEEVLREEGFRQRCVLIWIRSRTERRWGEVERPILEI